MKNKQILLSLFLLSIVITLVWFRRGLILATAEEGMPFYLPTRSSELFKSIWVQDAMGYLGTIFLVQYPLMVLLKFLNLVFSAVFLQGAVFGFLIFSGFAGTYYLVKYLTGHNLLATIASLFYFFNLYSMSQVWNRALFGAMFTWAYLPVFLFLWTRSLKEKNWAWTFLFLISSFIYSYSYSYLASLLVLWIPAGLWLIVRIFTEKRNAERLRFFGKSLLVIFAWVVVNLWWLYPYLTLSTKSYAVVTTSDLSFESLRAVSGNFPLPEILQLRQKFFFYSESNKELPWGTFYESWLTRSITWAGFALVFWGWIKSIKSKYWKFLSLLLFVALFISKGTNPPFGFVFYKFLFEKIPFLTILRNSYEKFGLVFLLPYSIFLAYGVNEIVRHFSRSASKILFLGVTSFALFGYLVFPLWNGKVFLNYYFVEVPSYYKQLNEFLKKDSSDGRVLMTPMLPSHGVRYSWGYRGDEPSRFLFNRTVISRNSNTKYYSELYSALSDAMSSNKPELESLLSKANIKYILVNYDTDWKAVGSLPPEQVKKSLQGRKDIRLVGKFGKLELFEFIGSSNFSFFEVLGKDAPSIDSKKLNAGHYQIFVKGSREEFQLTFRQTFDDSWKASIGKEKIVKHYIVYNYANAWNIDRKGDFVVDVKYKVWPWD